MDIKKILKLFFVVLFALSIGYVHNRSSAEFTPSNWMLRVLDRNKLCEMNIPGTHRSASKRTSAFRGITSSCQSDTITEQLEKGVRYLDIGVDSDLWVNYGGVKCYKSTFEKLSLSDVFDDASEFLEKNPTETVIIQLHQEGDEREDFESNVDKEVWKRKNIYLPWKDPSALTLGDVRGHILLFSQSSNIHKTYRFDRWAENCACWQLNLGKSAGLLQNFQGDKTAEDKMKNIRYYYKTVWEGYPFKGIFYINFTNCGGAYCPKSEAKKVNEGLKSFISENLVKKFGILVMDNPDYELIHSIYSLNYSF